MIPDFRCVSKPGFIPWYYKENVAPASNHNFEFITFALKKIIERNEDG
jgi:hypothetical protein